MATRGEDPKKYSLKDAARRGAQGELSAQEIVGLELATSALNSALETLGVKSDIVKSNINGLNEAFKQFNKLTQNEENLLKALGEGLKGNIGGALKEFATVLGTQAQEAQKFQAALAKAGFKENARL